MDSSCVSRNDVCWVAGNAKLGRFLKRTKSRAVWDDVGSLALASLFECEGDAICAIRRKRASDVGSRAWRLKPLRVRRKMTISLASD